MAAYTLLAAAPLGEVAAPIVASLFGPLLAAARVALAFVLASERVTLTGHVAALANAAAGVPVTAMLLVQLAVDRAETGGHALSPDVENAFDHVEFGLDLSWDTFIAAGTMLFGWAMLGDRGSDDGSGSRES